MHLKETIYRELANGQYEYWTYSDGMRIRVSEAWAKREATRRRAYIVEV